MRFVNFYSTHRVLFWVNDRDEIVLWHDEYGWAALFSWYNGSDHKFTDGLSILKCDDSLFREILSDFRDTTLKDAEKDQVYCSLMYYLYTTIG